MIDAEQPAQRCFDLDILAPHPFRDRTYQVRQKPPRAITSEHCRLVNDRPGALQAHQQAAARDFSDMQISASALHVPAVLRHAAEQAFDDIRSNGCMPRFPQHLAGRGQIKRHRLAAVGVWRVFPQSGDEVGFQSRRFVNPRSRRLLHADMDEDRDVRVVIGDPERFEIGQRLAQRRRREAAGPRQDIGRDPLFGRRVDDVANDTQELLSGALA